MTDQFSRRELWGIRLAVELRYEAIIRRSNMHTAADKLETKQLMQKVWKLLDTRPTEEKKK